MFKPVTLGFIVYYIIYPVPPFSDASGYFYTVIFTKLGINQQISVLLYIFYVYSCMDVGNILLFLVVSEIESVG